MVSTIITICMLWCLCYGRLNQLTAVIIAAVVAAVLLFVHVKYRKETESLSMIDRVAGRVEQGRLNSFLKIGTILFLLVMTLTTNSIRAEIVLLLMASMLTLLISGLSMMQYLRLLLTPLFFIGLSGLSLLFSYHTHNNGALLYVRCFSGYLMMTADSQFRTTIIVVKAFAAVSCLYTLHTTTTMTEIIAVLRRLRFPDMLIEIMYLMYRYIFILFYIAMEMKRAAQSRLGYRRYSIALRTTGGILTQLFIRSLSQAMRSFEAMESRCYIGQLRFWEEEKPITSRQAAAAVGICFLALNTVIWI